MSFQEASALTSSYAENRMVSPIVAWNGHNSFFKPAVARWAWTHNTTCGDDTFMEAKDYDRNSSTHLGRKQHLTLNAHELATLLCLRDASVLADAETPDVIALQDAGLVQVITSKDGDTTVSLTVDGKVLLRMLGAEPAEHRTYAS
jgi:hypothetical protein